jgi:hypothetical protein
MTNGTIMTTRPVIGLTGGTLGDNVIMMPPRQGSLLPRQARQQRQRQERWLLFILLGLLAFALYEWS